MHQKNRIFRSFLISNILIMMIPLVSGILFQQISFNVIRDEMHASNLAVMRNTGNTIDRGIEEIEAIIARVSLDDRLYQFINMPPLQDGSPEIKTVREAYLRLSDLRLQLTSRTIIDLAVYSHINQLVVSTRVAYSRQQFYYGPILQFGELGDADWRSLFFGQRHDHHTIPETDIWIYGKHYRALTYLQTIPYVHSGLGKGVLFAFLDTDQLMEMLRPLQTSEESHLIVLDRQDEILMQLGQEHTYTIDQVRPDPSEASGYQWLKTDGGNYLVTHYRSPINRWTYIAVQPESVIIAKLAGTRQRINLLMGLALLFSLGITVFLAWRKSSPIEKIYHTVSSMQPVNSSSNPIAQIDAGVSRLMADRDLFQQKLEAREHLLRGNFIRLLINNDLTSEDEFQQYCQDLGMRFDQAQYLCAILAADDRSGRSAEDFDTAAQQAFEAAGSTLYWSSLDYKKYVILYESEMEDQDDIRTDFTELLGHIRQIMQEATGARITADIGFAVQNVTDSFQSYQAALTAHEERSSKDMPDTVWYADCEFGSGQYRFSLDSEFKLASMVREGKIVNVEKEMARLVKENLIDRDLSVPAYRQLVQLLASLAERLGQELENPNRPDMPAGLENYRNRIEAAGQISHIYQQLASRFRDKDEQEYKRFKSQFTDYIEQHYSDPNLTLAQLADAFGILESTAYLYFKKKMNITFADYLEHVRIQHACEHLLQEGDLVVDVASLVGYNSSHSFRRAFKRLKGVTPSVYKDMLQDMIKLNQAQK